MAKKIDDRIARASKAKDEARRAHLAQRKEDSARLLTTLLTRTLEQRFAALAPGAQGITGLIAADRLTLLKSLREPMRKTHAVEIGFATPFEIFRSRLRYKTTSITVAAMLLAATASLLVVALRHTPMMWVEVTEDQQASVLHPDGTRTDDTFYPHRDRYQLMRVENGVGLLRSWVPGSGYEYFSLPQDVLAPAQLMRRD